MKIKKTKANTVVVTLDPVEVQFVEGVGYCDECWAQCDAEVCYALWQKFNECKGGNFQEVKE